MDVCLHKRILILALVIWQVFSSRVCPSGELEHQINDTVHCCKPHYHCPENWYVSICKKNHTEETCESCPDGTTLAFTSSSFDRKQCYTIPACNQGENKRPDLKAVNSSNCTCNWTNGMYAKKKEKNSFDSIHFDCQFRHKCPMGEEPKLFADGCDVCKDGFYQDQPSSDWNMPMCKASTNCSLLGLEELTPGNRTQNAVCRETNPITTLTPAIHTSTGSATDDKSTPTVLPVTDVSSTSHRPKVSSTDMWKILGVISAVVAIVFGVVLACCLWWFCCRRRQHDNRDLELQLSLVNDHSPNSGNNTNNPPTTPDQNTMETVLGSMRNGQVPTDNDSNGMLNNPNHVNGNLGARPKQKKTAGSKPENDNVGSGSLQPGGVSETSGGPDEFDQTLLKPKFENMSRKDPFVDAIFDACEGKDKDTLGVSMKPDCVSVLSHGSNDPPHQTVVKPVYTPQVNVTNPRDSEETDVKTPYGDGEENKNPNGVQTGRALPQLKTQFSNVSDRLPSSPITPDSTKPHAIVKPLIAVENSDNSSSVVGIPSSSSVFSSSGQDHPPHNLAYVAPQRQQASDGSSASGYQPSSSPHFPELRGDGSLSDTSSQQTER